MHFRPLPQVKGKVILKIDKTKQELNKTGWSVTVLNYPRVQYRFNQITTG